MAKNKNSQIPGSVDSQLIAGWARRYAKSRTISFLVQWIFIVLLIVAIGLATEFTNEAYREGRLGALYFSVIVMVLAFSGLAWFSVSARGGEVIWRITQWLYGREGYVSDSAEVPASPWWITA